MPEALELEKFTSNEQINKKEDAPQTPKKKSTFWSNLTMEPALAGAMMAIFLGQTSLQNFYLKTACSIDLKFPETVCDKGVGEAFRDAEIASQELVSSINVSRGFVGALISTIVLLFLGPWSDCSGRRKPLIIISLLGMCVSSFNVLLMLTFPIFSSVWVLYMVQIPMSLGGNFGLLLAAGFSYIGDVCHTEHRNVTMTMGKNRAAVQCSTVLGSIAGPAIYRYFGFYGVFSIVFSLQVTSLIFVILNVRDVKVNPDNRVSVLDVRLPFQAVKCLVRQRKDHRRKIVILMMLVAIADKIILAAALSTFRSGPAGWLRVLPQVLRVEDSAMHTINIPLIPNVLLWYMYARNKFHWDDMWFGSYIAYKNLISVVGTLMILRIFKAKFNMTDELVGVFGGFSLVAGLVLLLAARSTLLVFFVPVVGIIGQASQVVQRPIVNKQIERTEQGKIYSVVGGLEQAFQTGFSPLFSLLYSNTANSAPGSWVILCICLACIQLTCYITAGCYSRRTSRESRETKPSVESTIIKPGAIIPLLLEDKKEDKILLDEKSNGVDLKMNILLHGNKLEVENYEHDSNVKR